MFSQTDLQHMQRAIDLAKRGWFTTHPNPRVGCVIAHGDRVVGEGWHRTAGAEHAEVLALNEAGVSAEGATAYVTLEPHSFHGKTPPCTRALIDAGIARVICGALDPNPKVQGEGIRQLEDAGVSAFVGLFENEVRALNLGFEKRMRTGAPRVTVKVAASLDGRVALAGGESRWITSDAARADVQQLRASSSAVLTGVGTIIADDPQLNVRDPQIDLGARALLRIILDTRLRTPANSRMFETAGNVLIATTEGIDGEHANALRRAGAELLEVSRDATQGVDIEQVLRELGRRECNDVFVEAGPTVASRFLSLGLCDELIVYYAPKILGHDAKPMFQLPPIQRLQDGLQFQLVGTEVIGPDLKVRFIR